MRDIMTFIDNVSPDKGYETIGVILYGKGGYLKKPVEKFNRKEKLAYIESAFSNLGPDAYKMSHFLMEIRCSAGLSTKSFHLAEQEGLRIFSAIKQKT